MRTIKRHDWFYIVLGIVFLLCALIFLFAPRQMLVVITLLAGVFYLVSGLFTVVKYIRFHKAAFVSRWALIYGILTSLLGLMFLIHPLALAALIPWLIGLFICTFGVFQLFAALRAKKTGVFFWGWIVFSAIVQIFIGFCFFLFPTIFVYFIALFLMMQAIDMILMGWNAKGMAY